MAVSLRVNGEAHRADAEPDAPLLYVLRNDLGLNAAKFGCGLAQCGACAVLVDGAPVLSCVTPAGLLEGREITTLEGLGDPEAPHPLQAAFIELQALQCGYCANGMIIAAAALLEANPNPDEAALREALSTHLCRCGAHPRIIAAVLKAAGVTP